MIKRIKLMIYIFVLKKIIGDYDMLYLTGKQLSQINSLIGKCEALC